MTKGQPSSSVTHNYYDRDKNGKVMEHHVGSGPDSVGSPNQDEAAYIDPEYPIQLTIS